MSKLHNYFREMNIDISWYGQHVYPSVNTDALNIEDLEKDVSSCTKCILHKTRHQTVFGAGSICPDIMIVGEAPGKEEDEQGMPFVGRAGKLLTLFLESIGVNRKSIFITNTVKCRPPDNRNPMIEEMNACSDFLEKQIKIVNPKVLVLLGKVAANRLLGVDKVMSELRQKTFHIDKFDIPIIVFYHPAYILRSPLKKLDMWQDLKFLNKILKDNVS